MELWNLIKCEFIKNFSFKKIIMIIILLVLCCFSLIKFEDFFGKTGSYSDKLSMEEFYDYMDNAKKEYENDSNVINEGTLDIFIRMEEPYKLVYSTIGSSEKYVWQKEAVDRLRLDITEQVALEQLIKNYNNKNIKDFINEYKQQLDFINFDYKQNYIGALNRFKDLQLEELKEKLKNITFSNNLVINSLNENAYYLYVKANCEYSRMIPGFYISEDDKEYCRYFDESKIIDEFDYRSINAKQFLDLSYLVDKYKTIPNREEYNLIKDQFDFENYESVKRFYIRMNKIINNEKLVIDYAFKNNLKHDFILVDKNIEEKYTSSKSYINLGLHLGIFIMIIIAITDSGIVAKEHDKGTIKLLLTKPVKRSKVLLSKLLYLMLNLYILWIIGSIIMFFMAGFKCGFSDLFTSKIIVSNGVAKEVNYFVWYLKELFICSIPIWCYLSILFTLSALTLSTSLTAVLTSITSVVSINIWMLISNFRATFLTFLSYTPIPYLDYWLVRYNNFYYVESISRTNLWDNYGLFISLIVGLVLFFITVLIYNKKDIKN